MSRKLLREGLELLRRMEEKEPYEITLREYQDLLYHLQEWNHQQRRCLASHATIVLKRAYPYVQKDFGFRKPGQELC